MTSLQRYSGNPILLPEKANAWEHDGAFNGCVVYANGLYHMVYRALSGVKRQNGVDMKVSSVGYANSKDGLHFENKRVLFGPEEDWEIFGTEDPRITYMDGKFYIFYTALSVYPFAAYGIKLAVAITKDFQIFEKHPVTTFNSKAMALFPEKIDGKYAALLTINTDMPPAKIALATFDHEEEIWSPYFWDEWYHEANGHIIHLLRDLRDQIELGSPPIKTEDGWLVIYSYITNYMTDIKNFGIEAVLLDLHDPRKILGRTKQSLIVPERDYELYGDVPNIVFPSGALVKENELYVYYGAADTRVAVATCPLNKLLNDMHVRNTLFGKNDPSIKKFVRYDGNPVISPAPDLEWQMNGVFNPAAVYENGIIHIIYRAQAFDGTSLMGYASSKDGFTIDENLEYPIYYPREHYEQNMLQVGNSGCEDPRLTKIGDRYYMTYTAYDGSNPPRVALTSIAVDEFLQKHWYWDKPKLISPPNRDDKDACIVKDVKRDRYIAFHRFNTEIWIDFLDDIKFEDEKYLGGQILAEVRGDKWDNVKLGIAGPPLEIQEGWLLMYHAVSEPGFIYKTGALLLDYDDPTKILGRTDEPILEPEMPYELEGQVSNVVFPCGAVILDGIIYTYYGGADKVLGVASMPLQNLVDLLLKK